MPEREALAEVRAVVFDLDGTLVDSRPDLATAAGRLRAEHGLPPVDLETVGSWIGEGARRLVEKALADAASEVDLTSALARFLALYESVCTDATRPYAGAPELLAAAGRRGPVALLTNKPERMTRALLRHFGWEARFQVVLAGDSLPVRKPDGRTLVEVARRLELGPEALLLVGDSAIDAATARAAGSRFLWAAWGYARAEDVEALGRSPSASTPAELAERIGAAAGDLRTDPGGPRIRSSAH